MRAQKRRPRQAWNDSFGVGEDIAACGEAAPIFVILSEVAASADRRALGVGGHKVAESLCDF